MRKIYFFGIGILLICLAGWALHVIYKPHLNSAEDPVFDRLDATALFSAFQESETRATKKWVGRVIEISGTISMVEGAGKYLSITLAGNGAGGVNCSLLRQDLPAGRKFNIGERIIIKGRCTGFLMDVNLVDCIIIQQLVKS